MNEQVRQADLDATRSQLLGEQINVGLLDQVVEALSTSDPEERKQANELLCEIKADPNSWLKVDTILDNSKNDSSKYIALQILEDAIRTRWRSLPEDQRNGIREFIVTKIAALSPNALSSDYILNKMNLVLVQIVKKDWPHRWPSFINDLLSFAGSCRGSCVNSLNIFSLLSEEVFDFGGQNMTQAEERNLKETFCRQFEDVYAFCSRCLIDCPTNEIITAVLKTIRRFLSWIPTPTVFGSDIIALLVEKFLLIDKYRVDVLQCLSEVASISVATCDTFLPKMKLMFTETIKTIGNMVGETVDFANIYRSTNDENDQNFINSLTIFLTVFLKEYGSRLARSGEEGEVHKFALKLLLKLSVVDNVEVWKMCLEYWVGLTAELYRQNPYIGSNSMFPPSSDVDSFKRNEMTSKVCFYLDVLSGLRDIIIVKMARPEEVMLVESESGEVVREMVRDTDNINLYKAAKECLTYLTFLDNKETIEKMTSKLGEQVTPHGFDRPKLSTLCWAIGSIANTLQEEDEKRFLVVVVRELLSLCEMKRGKDNKAAIAANIMYVVGQYNRFLRAHWKFLKTVILKLFEFMHESHEGVQDMSCDTFMKIVLKCKNMLAVTQTGEAYPFVEDILNNLGAHTCDLSPEQQCVFYEAMGHIIRAVQSEPERIAYLNVLMTVCSDTWDRIIRMLAASEQPLQELADKEVSREALYCVRLSAAVCRSFGYEFYVQLTPKFNDMLAVYQLISTGLKSDEINQVDIQIVKNFRAYKKDFLVLMSTWIAQDRSVDRLKSEFFNPLMDAVLFDYNTNTPETRDAKVLSLLAIIVTRLEDDISEFVPAILDSVLDCTIQMITQDMTNFPEHRVNLFQMILALVTEVFPALLQLPDERLSFIMETIYWAFQNSQREVAELGLDITREILTRVKKLALGGSGIEQQTAQNFYQKHFVGILEHVFAVLTDKNQVQMLGMTRFGEVICQLFESLKKSVQVSLNAENKSAEAYISDYLSGIFTQHYSAQLNPEQIRVFILGFFTFSGSSNEMKNHLKDFLVKLQEQQNGQGLDDNLFISERNEAIAEAQRKEAERSNNALFVDDDEM